MNFNVYLDAKSIARLERLAKARRKARNALIREAVEQLLTRDSSAGWPEEVLDFKGVPGSPRFESSRGKLVAPHRDPLA